MVAQTARSAPTPTQIEARWLNAFRRARECGADPIRLDRERWAVKSASCRAIVYLVAGTPDGLTCTCPAHTNGNVACWHKAAVLADLARAPKPRRPEPTPPTPVAA